MSRTRQQRQSEMVRGRILAVAKHILTEEGEKALSIRRITKEMDYSAGIVYHYFKNKEEIVACVLEEEYRQSLAAARPPDPSSPPDQAVRSILFGVIYNGLQYAAESRAILFSASPRVLAFSSVLGEDSRRPALEALAVRLDAGVAAGLFAPHDAYQTAQALWCAVFGLTARLLVEQDVSPRRRTEIIERQLDILINGLRAR